jgi:hypothetical protein
MAATVAPFRGRGEMPRPKVAMRRIKEVLRVRVDDAMPCQRTVRRLTTSGGKSLRLGVAVFWYIHGGPGRLDDPHLRRGKLFPALEHPVPIDWWQDSLFEQPGQTRRAGALDDPFGESRKEFSAVTELREDNAPAFDR